MLKVMHQYMKKSLLISLIVFIEILDGRTQSFEGTITYSVEFEMRGEFVNLRDQIFEKLRDKGGYYDTIRVHIKQDRYKKVYNSINQKSVIYLPDLNKIYSLEELSKFVSIIDASKVASINLNFPEPNLLNVDSIKFVKGIPCNTLKLSWENLGDEWYFYNKETAVIDPELYENHNHEYLNQVLRATGSYPLEMVKSMDNVISIRMSLISVEEGEVSDDLFKIPELKKANKKMSKMVNEMTGGQVMEIKN